MNRSTFRTITLCTTCALLALIAVQAWSLWRMYADREQEFVRKVTLAMNRAAYDDLLLGAGRSSQKAQASFISSGNIDSIKVDLIGDISVKNLGTVGKTIAIRAKPDTLKTQIAVRQGGNTRYIYQELRMPSVSALKLDLARYDSLLRRNFAVADISLPFRVDVVLGGEAGKDSAVSADSGVVRAAPEKKPGEVVIAAREDAPQITAPRVFTCRVTPDERLMFRVLIENPARQVLCDMAGIFLSSLLMLCVVAFALLFLLRTLFRQKSLEEMRMDFTHNITHELKTPIAVANAANDALLDFSAAEDPDKRTRYLCVIREQLTALSDMVQRILTMSLEESEDFRLGKECMPASELLEPLARRFRLQAAKPAEIVVAVHPQDLTLRADRFHLTHALSNLVDNALKYSGEHVHILISASREKGRLVLRVADDGIGIPTEAQRHLFDKFYRVPTGNVHNVKGFGLGLYYVRLIAAKHGGAIAVASLPGRGTTFTLTLPDDE